MKNILKHKNKIILGVAVAAVLAFVFWWGGDSASLRGWSMDKTQSTDMVQATQAPDIVSTAQPTTVPVSATTPTVSPQATAANTEQPKKTEAPAENTAEKKDNTQKKNTLSTPAPAEPQNVQSSNKELTCTLSVRCDTILKNINWFDETKLNIVPRDGVVFAEKEVVFYEGESVFNVLLREMKKNKIHLEFMNTPVYNSAYIEGIANLYELDCGELSGWVYRVNGWYPNYGCSRYILSQGDKIEWLYTCDLGKDVGSTVGLQKDE